MTPLLLVLVGTALAQDAPLPVQGTSLPTTAEEAKPPVPPTSGDIFVAAPPGSSIALDGIFTGQKAPGFVRGVPTGPHRVRADLGCDTATTQVTVRAGAVERAELALEPGSGHLSVNTDPSGAAITIDGEPAGLAPLTSLPLACGEHQVSASAAGRQSAGAKAVVPIDGQISLDLTLVATVGGSLAVTIEPFDADVLLDGSRAGTGPMTLDTVPVGPHLVSGKRKGYDSAEVQVTVPLGGIARADLVLARRPTLAQRWGLDRVPPGRFAVDVGVTVASLGLGTFGVARYQHAGDSYQVYEGLTYADDPEGWYADEVARPRTQAYLLGGGCLVGLGVSGFLWSTTTWIAPQPRGVAAGGTF